MNRSLTKLGYGDCIGVLHGVDGIGSTMGWLTVVASKIILGFTVAIGSGMTAN